MRKYYLVFSEVEDMCMVFPLIHSFPLCFQLFSSGPLEKLQWLLALPPQKNVRLDILQGKAIYPYRFDNYQMQS